MEKAPVGILAELQTALLKLQPKLADAPMTMPRLLWTEDGIVLPRPREGGYAGYMGCWWKRPSEVPAIGGPILVSSFLAFPGDPEKTVASALAARDGLYTEVEDGGSIPAP